MAYKIKELDNQNSCSRIFGTYGLINFEYFVHTTGSKCDTTAQLETIRDAVGGFTAMDDQNKADAACVKMRHGSGTWNGVL